MVEKEIIDRIIKISKLKLEKEEYNKINSDLEKILKAFSILDELEINVEPAFHSVEIKNTMRSDDVRNFQNIVILVEHIETFRGYIRGPRVI